MCANLRRLCYLVSLLLFSSAPVFAAQVPREASPAEALRARVLLYYGTLEKREKTAALELVAPESNNDFVHMNYDGLVDFRVLDVQLSDAGDTATVRVRRTDSFLGFPQLLNHETVDKWKRLDGQWYIVLPSAGKKRVGHSIRKGNVRCTGRKHTASYTSHCVAGASDRCEPGTGPEGSPESYVGSEQTETRR